MIVPRLVEAIAIRLTFISLIHFTFGNTRHSSLACHDRDDMQCFLDVAGGVASGVPTATFFPSFTTVRFILSAFTTPSKVCVFPSVNLNSIPIFPPAPTRNSACTVFASSSKATCSSPGLSPLSPSSGSAGTNHQTTAITKCLKLVTGCSSTCETVSKGVSGC